MTPKERADLIRNLEDVMIGWVKEEGFTVIPQAPLPGSQWGFIVQMPGGLKLQVLRPKGQHKTVVLARINMSPDDASRCMKLAMKDRKALFFDIRRVGFAGATVGLAPTFSTDFIPEGWLIDAPIYDDEMAQSAFGRSVHRILTKHLELHDVLAGAIGEMPTGDAGGPSYG